MNDKFVVRGYGRASTEHQVMSPEQQEAAVVEAFEAFKRIRPGWHNALWGGFYFDEATTRTSKFRERPVGSLVLAMTQPGDIIMSSNYDRIFANVMDVCETLETIEMMRFRVIVLDLDIPLDNDLGRAVFKIMAAVKELEVKETRRRCRNAAKHRLATGLPVGKAPLGWRLVAVSLRGLVRKYLVPDEAVRALGKQVMEIKATTGLDYLHLTEELNRRRLRNAEGNEWARKPLARLIRAAAKGFPLHGGQHEAAPIPPDADPVVTMAPLN